MSIIYIDSYRFAAAPPSGYDPDAAAYIARVEGAFGDNQALETAVKDAINAFVVGCKADGIWSAIKASCILAGARTLNGALQPLTGAAPTNNGFIGAGTDYDRKTGLVGDGTTKYLNTNRDNTADPQNNKHVSAYVSVLAGIGPFLGAPVGTTGNTWMGPGNSSGNNVYNLNASSTLVITRSPATGLYGINRSSSSQVTVRYNQVNDVRSSTSASPSTGSIEINRTVRSTVSLPDVYGSSRIAFYSIGESLDLALLDARVTTLINAFAAAIP